MPPSQLRVRRAVVADAAAVLALRSSAIRVSAAAVYPADALEAWASGGSVAEVERMIETTAGFVACVGADVAGWANLDGAEVGQLYVGPAHGGRGVARAVYDAVERCARDRGLDELTTTASLRAVDVFARFGFTVIERHLRRYDGHDYLVAEMAKQLLPIEPDERAGR